MPTSYSQIRMQSAMSTGHVLWDISLPTSGLVEECPPIPTSRLFHGDAPMSVFVLAPYRQSRSKQQGRKDLVTRFLILFLFFKLFWFFEEPRYRG